MKQMHTTHIRVVRFENIRRTFSNIVIIKKMLKLIICAKKCIFPIKTGQNILTRNKHTNIVCFNVLEPEVYSIALGSCFPL